MLAAFALPASFAIWLAGTGTTTRSVRTAVAVDEARVDDEDAAGPHQRLELVDRLQVQHDGAVRPVGDRRSHLLVRQHHRAVAGAAAHLGAVGRHPGHLEAGLHAGVGQQLADEQDALAAEARHDEFVVHDVLPACLSAPPRAS